MILTVVRSGVPVGVFRTDRGKVSGHLTPTVLTCVWGPTCVLDLPSSGSEEVSHWRRSPNVSFTLPTL